MAKPKGTAFSKQAEPRPRRATSRGPKGRTGNHGLCEHCADRRQRRHNKYWCPTCHRTADLKGE